MTSQLFDQYIHYSHSGTASGSLVRSRPLFSCPLLKLSQVILCWRFRLNKKSLHCAKERIQCHGLRIVIQFHSARSEQCVPPDSFSGATEDGVEHGGSTHESLSARTEDRLRRCWKHIILHPRKASYWVLKKALLMDMSFNAARSHIQYDLMFAVEWTDGHTHRNNFYSPPTYVSL